MNRHWIQIVHLQIYKITLLQIDLYQSEIVVSSAYISSFFKKKEGCNSNRPSKNFGERLLLLDQDMRILAGDNLV